MADPQLAFEKKRTYLLFDGDCGLCHAAARLAERLDRTRGFSILPYQHFSNNELQQRGASAQQCARRVHVLTARGKIFTGAFAVNYFLWQYYPWKIFVALLYVLPPLLALEIIGYELIARNRRRLSQWLGFTACARPTPASTIRMNT